MLRRFALSMPRVGLGTWKAQPNEVGSAVRKAVRMGYQLIDCAKVYGNEAEIGPVLAAEDPDQRLWVTSKLWNVDHGRVREACEDTLRDLQRSTLSLYLLHWPVRFAEPGPHQHALYPKRVNGDWDVVDVRLAEVWAELCRLRRDGLVQHVGLCNVSEGDVRRLHAEGAVDVVQTEVHPFLQQRDVRAVCSELGIDVTAYSSLGNRVLAQQSDDVLLEHPVVTRIAAERSLSAGEVLLAWALRSGLHVIPKSTNEDRLRANLRVTERAVDVLTDGDMGELDALERGLRFVQPQWHRFP